MITSLTLSRKEAEGICIGDDITVTIQRIDGYQVRVAIDAPEDVPIVRSELLEPSKTKHS